MDEMPKFDKLDMSKIESFKGSGCPTAGGCSMGPGLEYPKNWELCIGGIVFKCDGDGNWINQERSC